MKVTYRGTIPRVRGGFSFAVSGCVHGCVLTWVVLGGAGHGGTAGAIDLRPGDTGDTRRRSCGTACGRNCRRSRRRIRRRIARPARARVKAPQTMVAGARDDAKAATLIWAPEPEVAAPKAMPLPNVVAVAAPKVVRPFVAPPEGGASVRGAGGEAPAVASGGGAGGGSGGEGAPLPYGRALRLGLRWCRGGRCGGSRRRRRSGRRRSVTMLADAPEVKEKRLAHGRGSWGSGGDAGGGAGVCGAGGEAGGGEGGGAGGGSGEAPPSAAPPMAPAVLAVEVRGRQRHRWPLWG